MAETGKKRKGSGAVESKREAVAPGRDRNNKKRSEKRSGSNNQKTSVPSRLFRSEKDRVIGGVAGGLGEYFNTDPTLIRLLFVLFAFIHGSGVLLYIILWIILPPKSKAMNASQLSGKTIQDNLNDVKDEVSGFTKKMKIGRRNGGKTLIGVLFLILGVVILFDNLGLRVWFNIGKFWPILLIIFGFYFIYRK